MPQLNQIIAIENGTKTATMRELNDAYHLLQKEAITKGISRTYRPINDEGTQLPPETTNVQVNANLIVDLVVDALVTLLDITATKDYGNTIAKANITVDDMVLMVDVPVPYLLFLEKKMKDVETFIGKLPTLDPSERWEWDESLGTWTTMPVQTTKTKKMIRNHVKAAATQQHPAQVEIYHEDAVVGYWETTKYSGALPANTISDMRKRVRKLQEAIKFAREAANNQQVEHVDASYKLLEYVFPQQDN